MPVRFQVDPDFYDHPKTAGMSDSAFSLWVRAGSYSAAKLTDGFIAETVLVHTLRSDTSVADELVERGLWRRRRGGYLFHEWERRNLTKKRVEDHHASDAKRKRESRKNGNAQVEALDVRTDSRRTDVGLQPESDPCCVGVGVGVNPSGTDQSNSYVHGGVRGGEHETTPDPLGPDSKPPRKRGSPNRGTRIPDDFAVTPAMVTWAREHTPHADGRRETDQFIDYWRARAGREATKLDWVATWRNAMRRAEERALNRASNGRRPGTDENIRQMLAGTGTTGGPNLIALPGGTP